MSDLEHSRELQEKFELYLLALIFTILGLAIQTAKLGINRASDVLEVLGWLSLMVSGLTGLSRLEWVPVALKTGSQLQDIRNERKRLADAAEGGMQWVPVVDQPEPANINDLIADRDNAIGKAQSHIDKMEQRIQLKYGIHKWSFVIGLVLLFMARAYGPVFEVFSRPATTPSCATAAVGTTASNAYVSPRR